MAVDAAPPERQRVAAYALLTRDREVLLTQMSSRTRIEAAISASRSATRSSKRNDGW